MSPIRYKVTKHQTLDNRWIVLWTNQYGECICEHFQTEAEADKFIGG